MLTQPNKVLVLALSELGKNKKMFYLFNRAGPTYKEAIFLLMKRLIQREEVPRAYDFTTLSQIWKKKGSPLSLDNMRFVHMKCWRAKLLEALITEKMKPKIVASTPNIQIGGNSISLICRAPCHTEDVDEKD